MNSRHCVHFASQGSTGSDSLAILRLRNDELMSIGIYYQLAVNNGVVCWFMLGHQLPDCDYTGKGRAAYLEDRDGFGKCVAAGVHFYQLRADETPLPAEDGNPQGLRSASIVESNDLMSDQELLIGIGSFFI